MWCAVADFLVRCGLYHLLVETVVDSPLFRPKGSTLLTQEIQTRLVVARHEVGSRNSWHPPHVRRRNPRSSSLRVVRPRSFPAPPWLTTGLFSARVAVGSRADNFRRPLSDFGGRITRLLELCAGGAPLLYGGIAALSPALSGSRKNRLLELPLQLLLFSFSHVTQHSSIHKRGRLEITQGRRLRLGGGLLRRCRPLSNPQTSSPSLV